MRGWTPLVVVVALLAVVVAILAQRHSAQPRESAAAKVVAAKVAQGPREQVAGVQGIQPPRSTPEEEQVESSALRAAADYAASRNSTALIVSRHGHIIFEQYWGGTDRDTVVDGGAFAATVAAMMVGIALDDRHIVTTDLPVANHLESFNVAGRDRITVRQLLRSKDVQSLVQLVEQLSGERYSAYLSRMLWKPISAGDAWVVLDRAGGEARADCCFFARQIDWMRLAQLLIANGEYQGSQILPQPWVRQMITPSSNDPNTGVHLKLGTPRDGLYLEGDGGSRLWMQPALHLAILRLGTQPQDWDETRIPSTIVAGVRDRPPAPISSEVDVSKLVPHH